MTIEIIQHGVLPKKKVYRGTCSYDGEIIQCLKEDAKNVSCGYNETELVVDCSCCGKPITVYPLK